MSFTKRALGALAAGAITLPFLASPALAAPGDTPIPAPRDITVFCANPTAAQFADVVASGDANANELALAIRCLATAGIALGNPGTPQQPQGIGANNYGPQLNVTRGQMTSFIARMIDAASARELREGTIRELPAPASTNPFPGDVPSNYVHLDNIKRLSQAGIVEGNPGTAQQPNGIGATRFGPDLPVTRSQMASFINRAVTYVTTNLGPQAVRDNAGVSAGFQAASAEYYVDAQQAVHERNVKGITAAGIAQGIGGDRYDGLGNVTRQQMARFIARTLATFFSNNNTVASSRILGLNNVFSANFPDGDRETATRLANNNGAAATAANSRTYTATGLQAGVEYRITLVAAGQVKQATTGSTDVRFATGTASGSNFLVATGTPNATIVSVNGAAPVNNEAAGTTTSAAPRGTAVAETNAQGVLTFTITGADGVNVVPVIYRNGGGDQSSYTTGGGADFRLEVDVNGRPIEFFGVAGETQFGAAGAAIRNSAGPLG